VNSPDFFDELDVFVRGQCLRPIGERGLRVIVDFDNEPIGAGGNAGSGKRAGTIVFAGTMRRINNHR
jgi:hypothetical protein